MTKEKPLSEKVKNKIKQLEKRREELSYHSDHHNCDECGMCKTCQLVNQTDAKLNFLKRLEKNVKEAVEKLKKECFDESGKNDFTLYNAYYKINKIFGEFK